MDRKELLQQALSAVAERPTAYGSPENNFSRIASLWSSYRGEGHNFTTADVAAMMALVKVARLAQSPAHLDSWVDLAGYAACGAEVAVPAVSQELLSGSTRQATHPHGANWTGVRLFVPEEDDGA